MAYPLWHGLSDIGRVRADNQDAIRSYVPEDEPTLESHGLLYAVADGMGGYEHGGVASALALETLFSTFYSGKPQKPSQNLKQGVQTANLAVFQESQRLRARMGTTLSAINLLRNECHIAHIGDSRIYQIRGRKGICLTRDHTAVGELVRMRLLSPDKVRTHDRRSILEKSLGMELFVQPDIQRYPVEEGDYFVLCTDGIWASIEDDDFGRIVHDMRDPERIGSTLLDLATEHESDDNMSVLVIHIEKFFTRVVEHTPANRGLRPLLRSWLYGKS
jgi:serine/threonine protein phosphatase PrpC